MSKNILKIIPNNPTDTFEEYRIALGKIFLTNIFKEKSGEIKINRTENLRFIDPGTNLNHIHCPFCHSEINLTWWQEAMDAAFQKDFMDLATYTPCCNQPISLNDLIYDWPAGFAKVSLEIENPVMDLDDIAQKKLEELLKVKLRKIWGHY